MKAVEVLMEHGVPEERIIFINLVPLLLVHFLYFLTRCSLDCFSRGPENFLWEIPASQTRAYCAYKILFIVPSNFANRSLAGLTSVSTKRHTLSLVWVILARGGAQLPSHTFSF